MNPVITQIAAQSHTEDLLRAASSQRVAVALTGRARRALRRRRLALRHAPQAATA